MDLRRWSRHTAAALTGLLFAAMARAQDATNATGSNTTTSTTTVWYGQWYVWVGIALFVIVIIALTNRGGTRSN